MKATGSEEEESGKMSRKERYFAQTARNCTLIQETGIVLYNPDSKGELAQIVAPQVMSSLCSSFSIRILKAGESGIITIGLVPKDYMEYCQPGWNEKSIGYHADNGGIYIECGWASKITKIAKEGDVMSFDINMEKKVGHFRKNGVEVIELNLDPKKFGLYPCIGIRSEGGAVQILQEDYCEPSVQGEFSDMFRHFDKDRDNRLTIPLELKSCLRSLGINISDVEGDSVDSYFQEIIDIVDPNETGYISFDVFMSFMTKGLWTSSQERFLPPSLTTEKLEDLWISPSGTVILTEVKRGIFCGWLSLHNPTTRQIAFRLPFEDASLDNKDHARSHVLQGETSWVEYLKIPKEKLCDSVKVEWKVLSDSRKSSKNEDLDHIFTEGKDIRRKELSVTVEESETVEDDDSDQDTDLNSEMDFTSLSDWTEEEPIQKKRKRQQTEDKSKELLNYLEKQWAIREESDEIVKTVEEIMQHASNLNMQDEETGFTPLHHAADLKLRRVAGLLLNGKANPHITDNEGLLPLDYAIDCKAPDDKLGELIVRKMKKSSVRDLFWNRKDETKIKLTVKQLLRLRLEQTASAVLDTFQNRQGSYCFAPLELDDNNRCPDDRFFNAEDETAYQKIAREEIKALGSHDCMKALTQRKWNKYARNRFIVMALVYLLSLFSLTFAAITGVLSNDVTRYQTPTDVARAIFELLACLYALITITMEVLQVKKHGPVEYLTDMFNYMEFVSSALILSVLPLRFTYCTEQWYVFAFGYLLWTFRIFKYAAMFRTTGIFGHILLRLIIYDVPKFVVLFLIVLLGFSGGLFLSLKGDNNLTVHEETSSFWGILVVGVRTLTEAQAVVDYTGSEGYRTVSCILMLMFLFVTCVLLLNILIAQLSDRFTGIQTDAEREFAISRAKIVARIELKDEFTCFYWGQALWKKHYSETEDLWASAAETDQAFDANTALEKVALDVAKNKICLKSIQEAQQSIQETQKIMQSMLETLTNKIEDGNALEWNVEKAGNIDVVNENCILNGHSDEQSSV